MMAETCSFIVRIQHLSKQVVLIDYTFFPLIINGNRKKS